MQIAVVAHQAERGTTCTFRKQGNARMGKAPGAAECVLCRMRRSSPFESRQTTTAGRVTERQDRERNQELYVGMQVPNAEGGKGWG